MADRSEIDDLLPISVRTGFHSPNAGLWNTKRHLLVSDMWASDYLLRRLHDGEGAPRRGNGLMWLMLTRRWSMCVLRVPL